MPLPPLSASVHINPNPTPIAGKTFSMRLELTPNEPDVKGKLQVEIAPRPPFGGEPSGWTAVFVGEMPPTAVAKTRTIPFDVKLAQSGDYLTRVVFNGTPMLGVRTVRIAATPLARLETLSDDERWDGKLSFVTRNVGRAASGPIQIAIFQRDGGFKDPTTGAWTWPNPKTLVATHTIDNLAAGAQKRLDVPLTPAPGQCQFWVENECQGARLLGGYSVILSVP